MDSRSIPAIIFSQGWTVPEQNGHWSAFHLRDFKLAGAYSSISKACIICWKAKHFPKKSGKNPVKTFSNSKYKSSVFFTCLYYLIRGTGWRRNKNTKDIRFIFFIFLKGEILLYFVSLIKKNTILFTETVFWAKTCFSELHAHAQYFGKE